ncbi:acetoacetate-CoA ligase [Cladophialophora bantiana CBS 173.52]|uniref:Acetoacetate-CoA ligase n=1 Tax=Cladophialophora bantiana (strain ATCC 10958 / CBS 173.52 / CDC B-1940 / NIH 8579) TaxID=1442370 RepID=A0A0D2G094_CLAB1|nr:acetoacetate-CoA ligase [Cladophialophora bantiana CBS 173.52]KIW92157.1 acetoacetate-CoA ligase [Cladophialophora bantiana CBS 173.52]
MSSSSSSPPTAPAAYYNAVGLPLEYCSKQYREESKRASRTSTPSSRSSSSSSSASLNSTSSLSSSSSSSPSPNSSPTSSTSSSTSPPTPLWTPPDPEAPPMSRYRQHVNAKFSQRLRDSHELHAWSVQNPHDFWIDLYSYCGIVPALPKHTKIAYDPAARLRDIPTFFPGLRLNYAENVLVPNTAANPSNVALVGLREGRLDDPEEVTWAELTELVRCARSAMVRRGIKKGDVIAGLMANSVWIVVLFLASASIGAIFTSVAPDLGVAGCVSRFAQVEPKWLFADVDLAVRGTRPSMLGKVMQVLQALPTTKAKPSLVFVPTCHRPHRQRNVDYITPLDGWAAISLHEFLSKSRAGDKMAYVRLPTDHPLVIVYSSGTTGEPKCIVSPHMSVLNYKKISLLHNGLGPWSTVFQFSSTSWILWNVMNGHLSVGSKVICYDGGALHPDPSTMLRICAKYRATYWGTSPRYLLELEQSGIRPDSFDLSELALVTTTGATLTGEQFHWFYRAFPRRIHLSSVAGGTDIASSWIATNPAGPVYANEMQMWALGHDCDILDSETGQSCAHEGRPGELVCRKPFPSMPCKFWGDTRDHQKYREAYFEKFPIVKKAAGGTEVRTTDGDANGAEDDYLDVWAQHDFIVMNPATKGLQILGRSDGVLNPSGIRFGSSEVYNIVEGPLFNNLISDTLCVGRRRAHDKDETVFLFVIMAPGHESDFTPALVERLKSAVRDGLSPRHVPKFVEQVREIPYTVNGKKVEVAVKRVISGQNVKVSSTVRNPACLAEYERFRDFERETTPRRNARASKL